MRLILFTLLVWGSNAFAQERSRSDVQYHQEHYFVRSLEGSEEDTSSSIASEYKDCGFSIGGVICDDSKFSKDSSESFGVVENSYTFTSLTIVHEEESSQAYVLAFEVNKDEKSDFIHSITLFHARPGMRFEVIKNDFLRGLLKPAFQISVYKDRAVAATEGLESTQNVRHLYYHSLPLVGDEHGNQSIKNAIERQMDLLTSPETLKKQGPYVYKLLRIIRRNFDQDRDFQILVGNSFLSSPSERMQILAAVMLSGAGEKSVEIKEILEKGIASKDWEIRLDALKGLWSFREFLEDDLKVLGLTRDSRYEVYQQARAYAKQLALTTEHLVEIDKIVNSPNSSTREFGLGLLAKIPGEQSLGLIASRVTDSAENVQKKAIQLLSGKPLSAASYTLIGNSLGNANSSTKQRLAKFFATRNESQATSALIALSNDANWSVRRSAVISLNGKNTPDVRRALIARVGDSDSDVKREVLKILNALKLSGGDVAYFQEFLGTFNSDAKGDAIRLVSQIKSLESVQFLGALSTDNSWSVRRNVTNALGQQTLFERRAYIIARLGDSDSDVRNAANEVLKTISLDERDLAAFELISKSPYEQTKMYMISLLGAFRSDRALRIYDILAKDQKGNVRKRVARHLGTFQSALGVEILGRLSGDGSWSIRRQAIQSLGTQKGVKRRAYLIARVTDSDSDVRGAANKLLATIKLDERDLIALEGAARINRLEGKLSVINLLTPFRSDRALELLATLSRDASYQVRQSVAQLLGTFSSAKGVRILGALSTNSNWGVRRQAIQSLERQQGSERRAFIIDRLRDGDSDVRAAASAIVKKWTLVDGDLGAIDVLSKLKQSSYRTQAAQLLGRIVSAGSSAILVRLSTDSNWSVRRAAVWALGVQNTVEARNALISRTIDNDSDVVRAAKKFVAKFKFATSDVPHLKVTLDQASNNHKLTVLRYLKAIVAPSSAQAIISVITNNNWSVRRDAIIALRAQRPEDKRVVLVQRLVDTDDQVRSEVLKGLNEFALSNQDLVHFAPHTKANSWVLRRTAARQLARIATRESTHLLIPMAVDGDSDVRGAVKKVLNGRSLDDQDLPVLAKNLSASNSDGVQYSAILVGRIKSTSSSELLIRFLSHGSWTVRLEAAKQLVSRKQNFVTLALLDKLYDGDDQVQQKVRQGLSGRRFNQEATIKLVAVLNQSGWVRRREAARYLAFSDVPQVAITALETRLKVENDSDVKRAISQTLNKLK